MSSSPRLARRRFLQQLAIATAAAPALARAARVNPPAIYSIAAGHYQFVPAGQVFCSAVRPDPGFEVVHAVLDRPLPLAEGYGFIEAHLKSLSLPIQALCGIELRAPEQMTFDAFRTFNRPYVEQLTKWELHEGQYASVCRTNVIPAADAPKEAELAAFSFVAPSTGNAVTFLTSGTADLDMRGRIVAGGSTSESAMRDKLKHVLGVMDTRIAEIDIEWSQVTHLDLYAASDVSDLWTSTSSEMLGNAKPKLRVHQARPPIAGTELEIEARGLVQEVTVKTRG